jgi:hypothetical protein
MAQKTLPDTSKSHSNERKQISRVLLRQWADLGVMVVPSGESEVKNE